MPLSPLHLESALFDQGAERGLMKQVSGGGAGFAPGLCLAAQDLVSYREE